MTEELPPIGAIYIAPKEVKEVKRIVYPRFVWRAHKSREGFAVPEVWHLEQTTGRIMNGRPERVPTLLEHELEPEDDGVSFDILKRIYPPPAPYKEWKQPNAQVHLDSGQQHTSEELS